MGEIFRNILKGVLLLAAVFALALIVQIVAEATALPFLHATIGNASEEAAREFYGMASILLSAIVVLLMIISFDLQALRRKSDKS